MQTYYEIKVGYKTSDPETNKDIKVKETYIIDAASYADAETQAYELAKEIHADEFEIKRQQAIKLLDILNDTNEETTDDGKTWFKVKVRGVDPETEKPLNGKVMVKATNIKAAVAFVEETYKNSLGDYTPEAVNTTDVFIVKQYKK